MTAKEKANELIEKFYKEISHGNIVEAEYEVLFLYQKSAKACAMICVDEILSQLPMIIFSEEMRVTRNPQIKYWQEVKSEIKNS